MHVLYVHLQAEEWASAYIALQYNVSFDIVNIYCEHREFVNYDQHIFFNKIVQMFITQPYAAVLGESMNCFRQKASLCS